MLSKFRSRIVHGAGRKHEVNGLFPSDVNTVFGQFLDMVCKELEHEFPTRPVADVNKPRSYEMRFSPQPYYVLTYLIENAKGDLVPFEHGADGTSMIGSIAAHRESVRPRRSPMTIGLGSLNTIWKRSAITCAAKTRTHWQSSCMRLQQKLVKLVVTTAKPRMTLTSAKDREAASTVKIFKN